MARYKELIEQSKKFRKSFDDAVVNLEHYSSNKTIEEEIIYLEKLNEFLDSKLQIADIDSLNQSEIKDVTKNKKENVNYESELLKKLLHKNIHGKFVQMIHLSGILDDLFMNSTNDDDDPEIKTFKENIRKQLENLTCTNDALMKLSDEQNKLIEDIIKEKISIQEEQIEYKENLISHAEKSKKNTNEIYTKQMMSCEKRIEKINFMRVLATQLLICGNIFEKNDETIAILERLRHPVTLETLKDMPDH